MTCKKMLGMLKHVPAPKFPLVPRTVKTYKRIAQYQQINRVQLYLQFFPEFLRTVRELGVFTTATHLTLSIIMRDPDNYEVQQTLVLPKSM